MMLAIPDVLDATSVARVRAVIDAAEWQDGNATSGHQSALAKRNEQLPEAGAAVESAVPQSRNPPTMCHTRRGKGCGRN